MFILLIFLVAGGAFLGGWVGACFGVLLFIALVTLSE